jgi:hypothetical protein
MADLNALIAQGAQFQAPPDPFAQYGKMQQLQTAGLQNQLVQQQLAAAKLAQQHETGVQNYLQGNPDLNLPEAQNKMLGFGKPGAAMLKQFTEAKTAALTQDELKQKIYKQKRDFAEQSLRDLSLNPSNENIIAYGQDAVLNSFMTADQAKAKTDQLLAMSVPERQAYMAAQGAQSKDLMGLFESKPIERTDGVSTWVEEGNRRLPNYGQAINTTITMQPKPGETLAAQTAVRGQDIGASTATRGQDIGAATAAAGQAVQVRGQDIGASTAIRGQDIGAATATRGQDIGASTAIRGQDIGAATAAAGQAVTARGQDIGAATAAAGQAVTARGQDIGAATAKAGQAVTLRGQDLVNAREKENLLIRKEDQRRAADPAFQQQLAEAKATGQNMAKDKVLRATQLPKVLDTATQTLAEVDALIGKRDKDGKLLPGEKPHPGFENAVGATFLPGARFVPGTDAANFQTRFDQIKGGAFLQAFETLKGGGSITNVEGEKGTAALNRMSLAQSEKEFVQASREFQDIVRTGVERAKKLAGESPAAAASPNIDALLNKYK